MSSTVEYRKGANESDRSSGSEPLAGRIRLARAALTWESLWPSLWPALAVLGVFAIVVLSDVLPALPWQLHVAALALFAAAFLWTLWIARSGFVRPSIGAGRRRLELSSGMTHRPLFALRDELAGGADDPVARSLWIAHRARVRAALRAIRVGWPRPGLAARDPFALRAALVLLLVVVSAAAGDDAFGRMKRAMTPGAGAPVPPGVLDLWITPPDYTGLPPMLPRAAADGGAGTISVPIGSALLAQVSGGSGAPHLLLNGQDVPFTAVDVAGGLRAWRVGAKVDGGQKLVIQQGPRSLGEWTLHIIPDEVPTAAFNTEPAPGPRAALRFEYGAKDDYGVESVSATIRRADPAPAIEGQAPNPFDAPLNIQLTNSSQRLKEIAGTTHQDLTAHPWAGLRVTIQLQAKDALGQVGESKPITMVLPERDFQQAVARAIVEQRKILITEPIAREEVVRALNAIANVPKQYNDDTVVYLGLTMAAKRLARDTTPEGIDAVQSLMWDTALRVEDGSLSNAERELRALQQQLQDALARNAPDEEIERLMNELQEAINRYLQAMIENALRNPEQMRQPPDRNAMRMEMRDLQRMLDRARQMARTGARDAAREMLSQLQDMLESLRNAQPQMGQQQGEGQGQQMMQGMNDLIQRQQSLLDRTFRRAQPGQRGQQPGQRGQPGQQGQQGQGQGEDGDPGAAGEQEALRRELQEMMRQLGDMMGDMPGGLGRAERAMRDALDALQRGAPGQALRPQTEALDQMRSAMRELGQQLAERFGQGQDQDARTDDGLDETANFDPAGRPRDSTGTGLDRGDVVIPEALDIQRSREILDELLRRAGERFRPTIERDYIDRLLKRF